ncbi:Histone-like bacterial DNA-binding protein [Candidatus Magnetobacterium bavaricum]|uniref:Histone-like bacterial DNA-binding protein n=1 Tax=Candidatus Magnetobacterium bavaricum TaxID=29290 RepID=A0A0F3H1V9_9BACT|nr:Histone-like bacterial DNA-binding protein [Candidatus Magnetobacterium bavaricum]
MTKAELIDHIAKEAGLSKADTARAFDATIESIINAVTDGQKVTLVGFGTFSVTERKAREGRNPRTGDVIKIPEARVPKFVAGRAFKDAVNTKK